MNQFERLRLLSALMLAVTALFIAGGLPAMGRWRHAFRIAAIVGIGVALVAALAESALWLWRGGGR